jgi:hypothetical protein
MFNDYLAPVMLACYDAESDEAAAAEAEAAAAAAAAAADSTKTFTQAQINSYLADDRRKTELKYKAQLKVELQKQEKTFNELLTNKNLTEQERDSLRESLASVEQQLHSEKELLTRQKKQVEDQLTAKLTESEKREKAWESRFRESSIARQLQEAAVSNDAFNARQMIDLLRPKTSLEAVKNAAGEETGEYQVIVDLEVAGVTTKLSPTDAVKKMKEDASYANLFKSNVVSGAGSNSGTGSAAVGAPDWANMDQATYRKLRKEHPELIFGKK